MYIFLIIKNVVLVNQSSSSEEQFETEEKVFFSTSTTVKQSVCETVSYSSIESFSREIREVSQSRSSLHSLPSQMNASSVTQMQCSEQSMSDHSVISDHSMSATTNGKFCHNWIIYCLLMLFIISIMA